MKKLFFGALTMVALLASCSSEDDVVANNNQAGENDLVEIKLGTGSRIGTNVAEARAALEKWSNTTIGIYALGKNAATWDENETIDSKSVLLNNVKGSVAADSIGETPADSANVVTFENSETYYYPRSNEEQYNFYGYYPVDQVTAAFNTAGDSLTVTGPFDGTQDILWGKAEVVDNGYNAGYFRTKTNGVWEENTNTAPDLKFKHILTRFVFNVNAGLDYDPDKCAIDSIKIKQPNTYTMLLATKTASATEGTLTWGTDSTVIQALIGTPPLKLTLVATTYETKEGVVDIMLPAAQSKYEFVLNIKSTTGTGTETIVSPVTIIPTGTIASFDAGKKYVINLTVHGPKQIEVTATLEAWEDGGELDFDI